MRRHPQTARFIAGGALLAAVAATAWLGAIPLAHADEADVLYRQGLALKRQGKIDEAIEKIYQACKLRPDYTAARLTLGWMYLKKRNLAQAAETFEVATKYAKGKNARQQAFSGLGTTQARLFRWKEAEKSLLQAYELDPKDPDVNMNLGVVYRNLKQYDKSVVHAMRALASRPGDTQIMSNLAVALRFSGNYAEAEALLRKAVQDRPNDPVAHFNLGVIYRRQKKADLAIKHYQEAIRLKPSFAEPHFDLGIVLNQERRNREAVEAFKKFLKLTGRGQDAEAAREYIRKLEK